MFKRYLYAKTIEKRIFYSMKKRVFNILITQNIFIV